MELDGLCPDHELETAEPEGQLCEEEEEEGDVRGPLQGQDDGVDVSHEVDGEGCLKESEQPKASQLGHLGGKKLLTNWIFSSTWFNHNL